MEKESAMTRGEALLTVMLATALGGCGMGASDVDYSRDRAISDDIAATYQIGPNGNYPGRARQSQPLGAFPWQLDERHQAGR